MATTLPAIAAIGIATAGAVVGGYAISSVGEALFERLFGAPTERVDWVETEKTFQEIYGDQPDILAPILIELATAKSLGGDYAIAFAEKYGALVTVERVNCFPAGTLIDMWPLDASLQPNPDGLYDEAAVRAKVWQKPIEDVALSDNVVSYDPTGAMKPGIVDKLFTNTAPEFITLSFADNRPDITTTPGHRFLSEAGDYMEIESARFRPPA